MSELKQKLKLAVQDPDALKELTKFGLTPEIIEGIEDLKKPATFDEALTSFNLQSEFDKRIAKAINTREENLKAQFNFVAKEQTPPIDTPPTPGANPQLDALMAEFNKLAKRLDDKETLEKQTSLETKKANAVEALKSKGIPAIYVNNLDLDKDLNEQLPSVEAIFQTDAAAFGKPKPNTILPTGDPVNPAAISKEKAEEFKGLF
jgi:hypothetical protein